MSKGSIPLPILAVEAPDDLPSSGRRRSSVEAYESAPDQAYVRQLKRNDSLNEFIMNKDKEKKEAMAAAASSPTVNPFKLSSGQKNTGSSYAQKLKAGDTFKQFRKPAGIPSFGAAISEDGDEEDATPSQPAAAIASAAALPKPRFGQPLDQLPDQRFTQKIQAGNTLKTYKRPPPASSLFETAAVPEEDEEESDSFGGNTRGTSANSLPSLPEEDSIGPMLKRQLHDLPDQRFTQQVKMGDTFKQFRKPATASSLFGSAEFAAESSSGAPASSSSAFSSSSFSTGTDARRPSNSKRSGAAARSTALPSLPEETVSRPFARKEMSQLADQQFTQKIKGGDTFKSFKKPPTVFGLFAQTDSPSGTSAARTRGRQLSALIESKDEVDTTNPFSQRVETRGPLSELALPSLSENDGESDDGIETKSPSKRPAAALSAGTQTTSKLPRVSEFSIAQDPHRHSAGGSGDSDGSGDDDHAQAGNGSGPRRSSVFREPDERERERERVRKARERKSSRQGPNSGADTGDAEDIQRLLAAYSISSQDGGASPSKPGSKDAARKKLRSQRRRSQPLTASESVEDRLDVPHGGPGTASGGAQGAHRRAHSAVAQRNVLVELFKLINTLSRKGMLSQAEKGYVKELVIKQDESLTKAALAFIATADEAAFEGKMLAAVQDAVKRGLVVNEAPDGAAGASDDVVFANFMRSAQRLFDRVDSDHDGLISHDQALQAISSHSSASSNGGPAVSGGRYQVSTAKVEAGRAYLKKEKFPEKLPVHEFARLLLDLEVDV